MPQQTINIGSAPDDGTGDTLRVGGDKINDNFTELYAADAALGTVATLDFDTDDTLAADSDSLIPTQQAVKAYVDGSVGSSITELDDVPDVNAPSPADGDVLTWDSTPGEWVPAAPVGGANDLDDLGDVNAPSPANGDVLTWDSTPGEWVASAPAAGGGWTQILASTSIPNPSAQYDISGLSGYSEILILARNMTASAAGFRVVQAGKAGTFYSTSGDYKGISTTTGAESNAADWGGNGSSTASAATIATRILNNKAGAIPLSFQAASVPILFVGTTAPIDSARIKNTSGNLTGGTVEVWGRA